MSIEALLERVAVALEKANGLIELSLNQVQGEGRPVEVAVKTETPKAPKGGKAAKADQAAEAVAAKEETPTIPYEDVSKATVKLGAATSRDVVMDVLAGFGVTSARDLKPDQFGPYIKAAEAAALA